MPGMSLVQPSLCVLNVPALLTLRQDGCHVPLRQRGQLLHSGSELVMEYSSVGHVLHLYFSVFTG